jgi:hypothetical protein
MEDVDALKSTFKEESYIFVVDSEKRDNYAYTSPSEYTIQFNAPFKNVIGLELLDASIPRTEYIIDTSCNTIVYTIDNAPKKTATIPPGDYNLLQFCEELTSLMDGLTVEPVSTPYSQTSTLKFFSITPFTLHLSESSMRRQLGFPGTEKKMTSTLLPKATATKSFTGPSPGYETHRIDANTVLRQVFVPAFSGPIDSIVAYVDLERSTGDANVSIQDEDGTIYGTGTLLLDGRPIVRIDGTTSLTAGETYYLVFQTDEIADIFVNASSREAADEASSVSGPWTPLLSGDSVACEVWSSVERHELVSTGLVDLTGPRYVMVRCPEIETYLFRERAYEPYYAGLGMVKLGGNGMRDQRFDFVSFPPRKLTTPLGKLSSLTFKLEKPDGTMYNSRGINNTLVLVIRYYACPKAESTPEQRRILNPQYIQNPVTYMEKTNWHKEVDERDVLETWPRGSRA